MQNLNELFWGYFVIGIIVVIIVWVALPLMVNIILQRLRKQNSILSAIEKHLAFQNKQLRQRREMDISG